MLVLLDLMLLFYGISNGIRLTPSKGSVVGHEVAQICLLPTETPLDISYGCSSMLCQMCLSSFSWPKELEPVTSAVLLDGLGTVCPQIKCSFGLIPVVVEVKKPPLL